MSELNFVATISIIYIYIYIDIYIKMVIVNIYLNADDQKFSPLILLAYFS